MQINNQGKLQHLLDIETLSSDLIHTLLDKANQLLAKQPIPPTSCSHDPVALLFFEPSTRTQISFELAIGQLGRQIIKVTPETSSHQKGESLIDTFLNLQAMGIRCFILRSNQPGAADDLVQHATPKTSIINAGDGHRAHPTQALLDMLTIQRHKTDFQPLSVAIVGDIKHSRVARSQVQALKKLGTEDIRLIAPDALLPNDLTNWRVTTYNQLTSGLANVDVIITLRLQKERMSANASNTAQQSVTTDYQLHPQHLTLAKKDVIVMHPGPINWGTELHPDFQHTPCFLALEQVKNGVALRTALLHLLQHQQP